MPDQTEQNPLSKHLTVAVTALILSLALFLAAFLFLNNLIANSETFFLSEVSSYDFLYRVTLVSFIANAVLIAYIAYLLAAAKTRTDAVVWEVTRGLERSREQFRMLYEGAPVPYVTLDKDGNIHEPNKATLRFFGVVPEEIKGKNLFSYCAGDSSELAEQLLQYYERHVPINEKEVQMITKSGEVKWVQLSVFSGDRVTDPNQRGLACILDITEQKRLDDAKTQFLSLASHQLRAPTAAIKWLGEMLLSGEIGAFTEKQRDYLTRLLTVDRDMIELVDTLLNVSRLEIGSLAVDIGPTNVPELCRSILAELKPSIEKKGLHVEERYQGVPENIQSDPKLLRIIIHNFVSNSVKYTPDGGTIAITLNAASDGNQVTVSDNGYGIPAAEQSRIFTKLYRASNVRAMSSAQGTGLGLYLVQQLANTLGGSISFVSEENKGSSFTLTLAP